MPSDLGLPGIMILGEYETWARVVIDAEPADVVCPHCGKADKLSDPDPAQTIDVNDTPSRGRPTVIRMATFSYRCHRCSKPFRAWGDGIDPKRHMTRRLIRYVENQAFRRPRVAIAREVGISDDRVRTIVLQLAGRLARHHRFPTPRVLGIDDIKLNRKTFTVLTDAESGRAIGLIDSCATDDIERWLLANVKPSDVQIIVSDLGKALIALAGRPAFRHAVHIADRWHVLQGCQKAMKKVLSQELGKLEVEAAVETRRGVAKKANLPRRKAKALRKHRPAIIGKKLREVRAADDLFDRQSLAPILADPCLKRVSRAFYARIELARVHHADDEASAKAQLVRFYAAASHTSIELEFRKIVQRVRQHEPLVLNFHRAKARHPGVSPAAFTTSSTERRNGTIRGSWKAGRGVTNLDYLRLLALYEPYQLDVDIIECGEPGCQRIEGPAALMTGLASQDPGQPVTPRHQLRCSAH